MCVVVCVGCCVYSIWGVCMLYVGGGMWGRMCVSVWWGVCGGVCVAYPYSYGCSCVHICRDQRFTSDVFLSCSPPYVLRQGLSLNLERKDSTRLPHQQTQRPSCLCLPNTRTSTCLFFKRVFEIQTQVHVPVLQELSQLSCLPSTVLFETDLPMAIEAPCSDTLLGGIQQQHRWLGLDECVMLLGGQTLRPQRLLTV